MNASLTACLQASDLDWYSFLDRPPLLPRLDEPSTQLREASILITGAAGSIGAALSLELASLAPRALILLDSSEQALYRLQSRLAKAHPAASIWTILGSVADSALLDEIFAGHRPTHVFHAAAHKHVALLEEQPLAALMNNALGTKTLAAMLRRFGPARLILLSTDKAVAPISILGAAKRIAEQIALASGGIVLRLGNVLGTSGSVVETFLQQIAAGEAVTITDREAERYFLTCEEAVALLLQAAIAPPHRQLLAPQIETSQTILSLAHFLIASCSPAAKIPIVDCPQRSGDKRRESLWSAEEDEYALSSAIPGCIEIQSPVFDEELLARRLSALETSAAERDLAAALDIVRQLVPSYSPSPVVLALAGTSRGALQL